MALPAAHPLASGQAGVGPISFRQLAAETFILAGPPGTGLYDNIIAACQAAGFNPRVGNLGASTGHGPRIASTLSLVGAGLGITCVPVSIERLHIDGVKYRRLDGSIAPKALLSIAARRGEPSTVVRQFLSIVRKVSNTLDCTDTGQ